MQVDMFMKIDGVEKWTWDTKFRGTDIIYGESIYTNRWETFGTYQLPTVEDT